MKKLITMTLAVIAAGTLFAQSWDWAVDPFTSIAVPLGTPADGTGAGWYMEVIGGNTTGGNTTSALGFYSEVFYLSQGFNFNADEGASVVLKLWDNAVPASAGWYIESTASTLATGLVAPPTTAVGFDFTGQNWVAVPEPATIGLFGLGALSAWIVRRNKLQAREEV